MPSKEIPLQVKYRGADYSLVGVSLPSEVTYRGTKYRLVSAQLPPHVQKYLQKKQKSEMEELLEEIEHISPHRSKKYDPKKLRVKEDVEQQAIEEQKRKITELRSKMPEAPEEMLEEGEEIEEIEFGAEEKEPPAPAVERIELAEDADIPFRVSQDDLALFENLPDAKYGKAAILLKRFRGLSAKEEAALQAKKEALDEKKRDIKHSGLKQWQIDKKFEAIEEQKKKLDEQLEHKRKREEAWVTKGEVEALVEALENYLEFGAPSSSAATHAQDLISRYRRDYLGPKEKSKRRKFPTYETLPRSTQIREFCYRGASGVRYRCRLRG